MPGASLEGAIKNSFFIDSGANRQMWFASIGVRRETLSVRRLHRQKMRV